jgi:RND family efflux transporter MFP subunit
VAKSSLAYLENNTVLYAPFSGIITGKYYEDGEIYSGAPNTQAGKAAIVTLMQTNPLKSMLNISENYYPMIKKGMEAGVKADVFNDQEFTGKVILVYPTIDAMTRSFKVELEVPNREGMLKPGMFTRVSMFVGEEEAFVVPSNTVLQQEGTNIRYIFVAENGIAKRYNVTIGKRFDEKIEILSDEMPVGGMHIVDGHTKLMNGDRVKVVK